MEMNREYEREVLYKPHRHARRAATADCDGDHRSLGRRVCPGVEFGRARDPLPRLPCGPCLLPAAHRHRHRRRCSRRCVRRRRVRRHKIHRLQLARPSAVPRLLWSTPIKAAQANDSKGTSGGPAGPSPIPTQAGPSPVLTRQEKSTKSIGGGRGGGSGGAAAARRRCCCGWQRVSARLGPRPGPLSLCQRCRRRYKHGRYRVGAKEN